MNPTLSDVVVCSLNSDSSGWFVLQTLGLEERGIEVVDLPGLYSHVLGRIPVFSVNAFWVLQKYGL